MDRLYSGKIGEAFKSLWLKNLTGAGVARTLPVVAAERLSDALACALLASVGVLAYPQYWPAFAAILAVLVCGIVVIQIRPLALGLLGIAENLPLVSRFAISLPEFYGSSYELLSLKNLVVAVGRPGRGGGQPGGDVGFRRRLAARVGGLGRIIDSILHTVVWRCVGIHCVGFVSAAAI